MDKTCTICGKPYVVPRCRADKSKFCGMKCLGVDRRAKMLGNKFRVGCAPNSTSFAKGLVPWNKGLSVHLSPASEFKKGRVSEKTMPIGSVTFRKDKRGTVRAWVKIANPKTWELRAVVVWKAKFGNVPKGCVIHHIDRDALNDDINNLSCMTRAAHLDEHRKEHIAAKSKKRRLRVSASTAS